MAPTFFACAETLVVAITIESTHLKLFYYFQQCVVLFARFLFSVFFSLVLARLSLGNSLPNPFRMFQPKLHRFLCSMFVFFFVIAYCGIIRVGLVGKHDKLFEPEY